MYLRCGSKRSTRGATSIGRPLRFYQAARLLRAYNYRKMASSCRVWGLVASVLQCKPEPTPELSIRTGSHDGGSNAYAPCWRHRCQRPNSGPGCSTQDVASPDSGTTISPPPSGSPTANANPKCRYVPAGPVHIAVGSQQTWGPKVTADCQGAYITVEPTDGRVWFTSNAFCLNHTYNTNGASILFKVKRCRPDGAL
jgi:hypothetical protein